MGGPAGPGDRLATRRRAWESFVAARGLPACVLDVAAAPTGDAADAIARLRAARWSPVPA
jgi:hypothetical protein